jgi:hypothetical protein
MHVNVNLSDPIIDKHKTIFFREDLTRKSIFHDGNIDQNSLTDEMKEVP